MAGRGRVFPRLDRAECFTGADGRLIGDRKEPTLGGWRKYERTGWRRDRNGRVGVAWHLEDVPCRQGSAYVAGGEADDSRGRVCGFCRAVGMWKIDLVEHDCGV